MKRPPSTQIGASEPAPSDVEDGPISRDRREALISLGKYSAFTAPTIASLLVAGKAEAFAGSGKGGMRPLQPKPKPKPKQPKTRTKQPKGSKQ